MKYLFPSIASLRSALVSEQKTFRRMCSKSDLSDSRDDNQSPGTDLRLQVTASGWYVHTGSSDYDQDHRGAWGASFLPYGRANLSDIARGLIEQAKGQAHENN
jgi:hypothetical protein